MKQISGLVFFFALAAIIRPGWSQVQPKAHFSQDSIQLGQPVQMIVSVKYDSKRRILFPDSSYSFFPFELVKKDFFPTQSKDGISYDSVVYTVQTFLPDSIQSLKIPIVEFLGKDSLVWNSNLDSVCVIQLLKGPLLTKPAIFEEVSPVHIPTRFNYPYLLIVLGVFFFLVLGINFFFNRPIQKFIYLFIEKRRNQTFISQFQRAQNQLEKSLNVEGFERIIILWKRYNQRVDGKPYTTFTSTEIFKILPQPELKSSLQEIDRWIYGGVEMKDWRKNINLVKEVSIQLYNKKREAIRNGRFE